MAVRKKIEQKPDKSQIINEVLKRISEGESLRSVLPTGNDLVSRKTFNEWLSEDKQLSDHYARACEDRAEKIFEELVDIADDVSKDTEVRETAGGLQYEVPNTEWISRSKVRIDTRKWMLSKMQPKKYGDKLDIDHSTLGEKIHTTFYVPDDGRNPKSS